VNAEGASSWGFMLRGGAAVTQRGMSSGAASRPGGSPATDRHVGGALSASGFCCPQEGADGVDVQQVGGCQQPLAGVLAAVTCQGVSRR
jgi:hypothetical protein